MQKLLRYKEMCLSGNIYAFYLLFVTYLGTQAIYIYGYTRFIALLTLLLLHVLLRIKI